MRAHLVPRQISMARFEVRVVTNARLKPRRLVRNAEQADAREFAAERAADGTIRCRVQEKPEKGKANLALIKGLSKLLGCEARIVSGATSRKKVIEANCSNDALLAIPLARRE